MANPEEQFCLRWNDYHESMVATLQELRNEDDFVDVTLVCEGGAEIRAHKLILSACSDFFRTLLKRTPPSPSNPVIVLWDISHADLQHILRYMYNGEVEVQQAHLNTFLAVAERLRVRGLCQSGGKSSPIPSSGGGHHHRPGSSVSPQPPTSSSHNPQHHSKSSSSSQRRRSSLDPISSSSKRSKYDADISIKEEEQHHRNDGGSSGGRRHEELVQPPSNPNDIAELNQSGGGSHHDDGSIMSRSGHGSEADYTEYGYGGGNGAGPSGGGGRGVGRVRDESERTGDDDEGDYPDPASLGNSAQLMGLNIGGRISPRSMFDHPAAKEIWRRAAMSHLGQRFGGSNSNSPSNSYGDSPQNPSGAEPARRQRSVYSSEQIQQLEAFFAINEYIDGERKKQLSMMTKIPEQQIKVWFQNRRQKKKRELEEHNRGGGGGGGGGGESDHHHRELMPPTMAREGDDVKYE